MRRGYVDSVSQTAVAGWAADTDRPGHQYLITISVNGTWVGDIAADRLRRDLLALGKYGDGRHGFSFAFAEPLPSDQDQLIEVRFEEDGVMLANGEHVLQATSQHAQSLPPEEPPLPEKPVVPAQAAAAVLAAAPKPLQPILVTAPGRSGTTFLMSCLAQATDVVAAELVPYELRLLSYYSVVYNVLNAPANLERSTHPDRLEGDGYHIGSNPFNSPEYAQAFKKRAQLTDYNDNYMPVLVADMIQNAVREYYFRLAMDKGKANVRFFAEKNNNLHRPTRRFVREVFGAIREIVIVRDPRDVLCSHMSYFDSSVDFAFSQLSHSCRELMSIRNEKRDDVFTIRYEDMIRGDAASYAAMSEFVGTKITTPAPVAGSDMFQRHGTSESPEASIGRWRKHLPAEFQNRSARDWRDFLVTFGYES